MDVFARVDILRHTPLTFKEHMNTPQHPDLCDSVLTEGQNWASFLWS